MRGRLGDAAIRSTPALWALVLALLMLGGSLGTGYVLSYDMVWVPDLTLGADALGLGTALPRAVPSDAVVAVLDEVVPGVLLQKVVLVLSLVAAGAGAAALAGTDLSARLVASSVAVWNPFVVERLAIGHWPVLVGYGVLPWVLRAGLAWRGSGVPPARLVPLVVLGSLSATTGLVTAVAVAAAAGGRSGRRWAGLAGLILVANLPWLASGLLHAGTATSSRTGADVFAPSGAGLLPGPANFLSLGGIWNSGVVLPSRTGWLGVLFLVLLAGLAALGATRGWERVPLPARRPMLVCWTVGVTLTVLAWALPGVTGWLASTVPGAGVLRDASRVLALAAPLTAVLVGRGAAAVAGALPDVLSRAMITGALALVPVTLMPDAALGLSGRLDAVGYPASYDDLVRALPSLPAGDIALLPFQSYRAPQWNNDSRPVLAPLGRYLPRRVVVEDQLLVDGHPVAGEDPRARQVRTALDRATPEDRAAALRDAGVRLLVVEQLPGVAVPAVAGDVAWEAPGLRVLDLGPGETAPAVPTTWRAVMALAWIAWLGVLALALGRAVRRRSGAGPR